jgi:hypothetical protein
MGVTHPRPSQCSGRYDPQTGRNAGRAFWPGAARERTANPPAGTVLAPPAGLPPEDVLSWARWRLKRFAGMVVKRATVRVWGCEESPRYRAFLATMMRPRNSLSPSRSVFKKREIRWRDKRLLLSRCARGHGAERVIR